MRRLFGFLVLALIPPSLLAQARSGSSSSSSGSNSSSSTSSSSSYNSSASSSSSRSNDSGSRSSDSGSRGSSSSYSGSSYSPPSRSNSEPTSRGSSTNTSGSSYHSTPTNNSSGYSNQGSVHDSRNGQQIQNRHEFPSNGSSKEPRTAFHGTDQLPSRVGIIQEPIVQMSISCVPANPHLQYQSCRMIPSSSTDTAPRKQKFWRSNRRSMKRATSSTQNTSSPAKMMSMSANTRSLIKNVSSYK
jgi:hypothetical protein